MPKPEVATERGNAGLSDGGLLAERHQQFGYSGGAFITAGPIMAASRRESVPRSADYEAHRRDIRN